MKEVLIYQCDYCSRTSFYKSNLRKHEKECFYNPSTHSCATCLWFSRANYMDFTKCFINKFTEVPEGEKPNLKIGCKGWESIDIVEEYELFDQDQHVLDRLYKGDKIFFKELSQRAAD